MGIDGNEEKTGEFAQNTSKAIYDPFFDPVVGQN